ncbi:MAG: Flp pilus assembly complex ATPase component TadA [Rhodospirillum sp.]|nr:Flp pilus assembly complex ATPase component TadA [Rhodospirillum sp.]MCF8489847.1 Flp pilus assembly complex ATPase component TadA [Rhodospirillum sp.]
MPPREDPARRGTLAAVLRKEVPLTLQDNWWENEGFPDPRDTPKPRTSAMAQRRVPGPTLGQALADHHRTAQTRDGNRTHATAPVPKVAPETAQTHPPEPNPKPAPALTPVPPPPPSTAPPTAPPTAPRDRLGEQLVDAGLISRDQLRVAITEQKGTGAMMGTVLVELGFITDGALAEVMAHNSGRDRFDPAATVPDPAALSPLPEAEARRLRVFPVGLRGTLLRLAMADPMDVVAIDAVRRHYRKDIRVEPLASGEGEIQTAIDGAYGHELSLDGVLRELEALGERGGDTDVISDTAAHPVVRLVNALLLNAVKRRASDIHFEPDGAFLRVRERVDGVLRQSLTFHKQYWAAVCQRVKILAGMDIADRLNPQDGRFSMAVSHRKVDFRASIVPTVHGENLVLRILDRSATPLKLEHLGLDQRVMDTLRLMIRRPEGMLLVVGPTGSGKTTTLYALMDHISGPDLNIVTLEDPVEYDLPLLRQTQVRDGGRMGFADGIRAMLRQDPDVILVGEVRDPDTAAMALRAAMTGHQVYSTLHANDAISALSRLADLGLRQGLLSGALMGILAQRLARKLCVKCRQAYQASPVECRILGVDPQTGPTIHRSQGCEACGQTGYRGRVPLTELLTVTPDVDALLADGAPISEIRALAGRQGYRPMVSNGARLVLDGVIDVAALMRAVDITGRLA